MIETNRRAFLQALLTGAAGLTLTYRTSGQGRGPAPITATKLTSRVVALSGAGGNVGLVIGPDGLIMIDGGLANRASDLAQAIAEVSPRMVEVLFNTHYHFDHVGSNEYLGKGRVRIIAHENVRRRLGVRFENPAMGRTMEPLQEVGRPTETFRERGTLGFGPETLEYTHTPMAHTDGDAFVFLPQANVVHAGDLFWTGRYPVVDYTVGGSLAAMAATLAQMDGVGDEATRIIPGHGAPGAGKAEMRQVRDIWLAINERLEAHAREGRSADDVVAAAPTRDFDARVGVRDAEGFVRQAYGGVLARRAAR
ncbi:MAG: MBL fold metallo-hydrolase [Acidobacteria bacterium]|nr:MBL fold metallo-hydrolase [Acidobacteriota bacterium]